MAAPSAAALYGHWRHSHEEDSDGEMVFRPAQHAFPPARGRTGFELRPDGSYLENSPGPDDRPEQSSGCWSLEGDTLKLHGARGRPDRTWKVARAEADRLTLIDDAT